MKWFYYIRMALYLGSGAIGFVALGLAVLGYWWSPLSPLTRDEPALLMSGGDVEGASRAYLQQANGWGSDAEREESLWRAAQIEAVELHNRKRAIQILEDFQEAWPDSDHRADAYALLAELYEPRQQDDLSKEKPDAIENRMRRAARTWKRAVAADPDHPHAGDWLVRSAVLWTQLEQHDRADATWRVASGYEDRRVEALMAIAGTQLAEAPERAYRGFRLVLSESPKPGDATLARLGMATALERMERYMDAEEAVDLALSEDLDDPALVQRKRRLETIR